MSAKEKQATLAAAIREDILSRLNFDKDTKTLSTSEGDDLYTKHLPEGVTPEAVKAVHEYNTTFAAAGAGAFVEKVGAAMKDDSDLAQVNYELPMYNKDKLQLMASRESGLSVGVVTTVVNHKAGQLKQVFAEFNTLMDELDK